MSERTELRTFVFGNLNRDFKAAGKPFYREFPPVKNHRAAAYGAQDHRTWQRSETDADVTEDGEAAFAEAFNDLFKFPLTLTPELRE